MSKLTAGQTSQRLLTSYTCTNWSNVQLGYIQWKIYSFLFYYFFLLGSLDSNTIKQTKCWQIYNICTGVAYIDLNEICQLTVNVYGTCSKNRQLFDNLTSFYTHMIFHLLWFYFIVKFLLWIVVAVNFYPMHAFLGKPYYWQEFKIKPWKLKKDMSYMWWYNSMFPFYCFCKRNEVEVNLNRVFFSIFFSLAYRNQVKPMFQREFITFIY